jgi:diguanylate cyclase (GGDEF)-like protein/PAS domain S-box-containing protein
VEARPPAAGRRSGLQEQLTLSDDDEVNVAPTEQFFRTVLDQVADAVITTDAYGCVTFANPAAENLYGISENDARGRNLTDLLSTFRTASGAALDHVTAQVATQGRWHGEITQRTPDGPDLLVDASISLLRDSHGTVLGSVSVVREISERKASERLIAYQATHDSLTGLLNRAAFMTALNTALRSRPAPILIFVDLNAFKAINDTHGHARGDEVLQAVAQRLTGAIRTGDLVGRFGGDEFVILAYHLHHHPAAKQFLDRLTASLLGPIPCRDGDVHRVGASIGIAHATPGDNPDTLLRKADMAMYQAKHSTETASAYRFAQ